jgi:hypothetical protein
VNAVYMQCRVLHGVNIGLHGVYIWFYTTRIGFGYAPSVGLGLGRRKRARVDAPVGAATKLDAEMNMPLILKGPFDSEAHRFICSHKVADKISGL